MALYSCESERLHALRLRGSSRVCRCEPLAPADVLPCRGGFSRPCKRGSGLLDLAEFQFHGRRTPENQHRHAQAALLVVDFLDHAVEVVERAVDHAHHLAGFEQHLRARLLDAFLDPRSEEHTSELQSLMRISYA